MTPHETPLMMCERHVREGAERIAHQEALIAKLVESGSERLLPDAQDFLARMLDFQRIAIEHRDRELTKLSPPHSPADRG